MKKILIFTTVFFAVNMSAQTLKEFNVLLKNNDTIGQQALLKKWKKIGENDPDYYVAAFNYNFNLGQKEVIAIQQQPSSEESLKITNTQDSTEAYLVGKMYYESEYLDNALKIISKGIEKFPDRLDMRFGKIYLLGDAEDYPGFTDNIVNTIYYSDRIKNKWKWKGGELLEDSKNFMLSSIQDYINQLYDTGRDDLLNNMAEISKTVLQYYPNHVESITNVGIVFMLQKNTDKAIEYFLKAEKKRPVDIVILGNIAYAYFIKKDFDNAEKYYEKIIEFGDNEEVAAARENIRKIKEIKNNNE